MSSVIYHAQSQIGKKVGDGECTRIAEYALKQAGMKTTKDFGYTGNNTDYVWGTPVTEDQAKPGDILQFRNHVMRVTRRRKDGELIEARDYKRGHHTAVVASKNYRVDDYKNQFYSFSILEQHVSGKHYVHKGVIQLEDSTMSDSNEEIQTEVTGTVSIYRPMPK